MLLILWYIMQVVSTCAWHMSLHVHVHAQSVYMHVWFTSMLTHTLTHTLVVWLDSLREALRSREGGSNQRRLRGTGIGDWGIRSGPASRECVSHIPLSSHNQIWRAPQVSESNLLYSTLWKTQMQHHLYKFWFSAKVALIMRIECLLHLQFSDLYQRSSHM